MVRPTFLWLVRPKWSKVRLGGPGKKLDTRLSSKDCLLSIWLPTFPLDCPPFLLIAPKLLAQITSDFNALYWFQRPPGVWTAATILVMRTMMMTILRVSSVWWMMVDVDAGGDDDGGCWWAQWWWRWWVSASVWWMIAGKLLAPISSG